MSPVTDKALTQGSSEPVLEKGVIRLYSMRFCPFAYRVRLVLAAKNILYETVNINLKVKPDWYLKKHPEGKVPLIEKDGKQVTESLIICDCLDEKYPEPKLWPQDPYQKATGRMILENFSKIFGHMRKALGDNDSTGYEGICTEFGNLDKQLQQLKTNFFSGDKPGMVDYMIWPFVEFIRSFYAAGLYKGDKDYSTAKSEQPYFTAWRARMVEDPLVKQCSPGNENFIAYTVSYANGAPNYDVGL